MLAQLPLVREMRTTGMLRWIASEISSWNAYKTRCMEGGIDKHVAALI